MATAKKPATKKAPAKKPVKKATAPEQTPAERLVVGVFDKERPFAVTLAETAFALKAKLEQQLPEYKDADLAQMVTSTQGEKVLKANPFVSEFRATARDYAAILRDLHELLDAHGTPAELTSLDDFRRKFNIG